MKIYYVQPLLRLILHNAQVTHGMLLHGLSAWANFVKILYCKKKNLLSLRIKIGNCYFQFWLCLYSLTNTGTFYFRPQTVFRQLNLILVLPKQHCCTYGQSSVIISFSNSVASKFPQVIWHHWLQILPLYYIEEWIVFTLPIQESKELRKCFLYCNKSFMKFQANASQIAK